MTTRRQGDIGRISGLAGERKPAPNGQLSHMRVGQSCPGQNPHFDSPLEFALGAPLSIRAVAALLGCSPWTVRQQHIRRGLPHFRSGPNGKLVFFRGQVVEWILNQQRKG